uniref:Uncharacterized protein n=1 Tax=Tetraodon nigroviridis TaxID=99883 RepID=H3BVQ7_TETNG
MDDALQTMTQSQTFSDVRSSSPEIFGLQEPSYIDTPLASVSQLSLKAQVKDMSYLPVLHYRSKAEKKLVAGIRLQYVSPQMEKVFGRIQSRFQETMSLAEKMGITKVLKSKNFIIAVTKMCLDSSPTTRAHGYALLHDMNNEAGTEKLLSLIDAKNRSRIEINLKKTRKQSRGWG